MSAVEAPPRPRGVAMALSHAWAWRAGVALLLLGALVLRVVGVGHGLPFAYNADENAHFVPKAIGLFGHGWNPDYFVNPPGYTYVLHLVYLVGYGGREAVSDAYASGPGEIFRLARLTSAVLGTIAVGLLYLAGAKLFDRRVGFIAAAVLAVAFLPVFYSHLGLNDVPTLAPVCLALWGVAGVLRDGRRRYWLLAGVGLGLACATKYTGGIVLLPLIAAAGLRWRGLLLVAVVGLVTFVAANPYAVITPADFWDGIVHQSDASSEVGGKLGITEDSGVLYYLWTLTWGLGWVPAVAAAAGAVVLAFKDRRALLVLAVAPILFIAFMGTRERFFGRWLIPVLPLFCLLAAFAAVWAADAVGRRLPALRPALLTLAAAALCVQGLVHSVHLDLVLSRADTRNLARAWLAEHVPARSKIVVEPVVPDGWASRVGPPGTPIWIKFPTSRARFTQDGTPIPPDARPVVNIEDFERTLQPQLVDDFERLGWCWVISGSTQSGRAFADPEQVPGAIRYYAELRRRARVAYEASPYRPGADPVAFNFDWSFDFYPLAYERPGPVMTIYRLQGGQCAR